MRPKTDSASAMVLVRESWEAVTSRASYLPLVFDVTAETASGVLFGLREVATTLSPTQRAAWATSKPKPLGQPVMSQIGFEHPIVG